MNLQLLSRLKTRDAALLYERLAQRVAGSGVVNATTYDSIAADMTSAGLTTSRGVAFTSAVVRSRMKELAETGVVEIVATESPATFDVYVYRPYPTAQEEPAEEPQAVDHYGGRSLFDFHFENENENENERLEARDTKEEYIYIKINKQINRESSVCSILDADRDEERRPLVNEIVADFDLSCEWAQKTRRLLAKDIYEPGLHADLLDRAVVAVARKYATAKELRAAVRAAKDEQYLRKQTNGFKGRRTLWETFAPIVKGWYDGAGVVWTPTSFRREPAPESPSRNLDVVGANP